MLVKILLIAALVGLAWMALARGAGRRRLGGRAPVRLPRVETLARCPECGVYRIYGSACDCPPPAGRDGG